MKKCCNTVAHFVSFQIGLPKTKLPNLLGLGETNLFIFIIKNSVPRPHENITQDPLRTRFLKVSTHHGKETHGSTLNDQFGSKNGIILAINGESNVWNG